MTNDKLEAARSGNSFHENTTCHLPARPAGRNEDVQAKLAADRLGPRRLRRGAQDVGHVLRRRGQVRPSATSSASSLGPCTRHFLLMTATPHNGKEEDFQLFMALLDADRFEGSFRDGVHKVDVSDLMRRMVKENCVKFDGTPLFPERRAYTVNYELSDLEAQLYKQSPTMCARK